MLGKYTTLGDLIAALAFYAEDDHYTPRTIQGGFRVDHSEPVLIDGGKLARRTLGMEAGDEGITSSN